MHGGDHRYGQFAPLPGALLRPVGDAVRAVREVAHARHRVAILLHRREACHVEAGAERLALAREHDAAQALHLRQFVARRDDALEHSRIEGVHLVGAD